MKWKSKRKRRIIKRKKESKRAKKKTAWEMALVWNAAKIGKMLVDIDFNLIQKLSRFSPGIFVLYCVCLLAAYVVHERR